MTENASFETPHLLRRGVTVWFTGLPSSGKSTLARQLERLCRRWKVPVELLDGDVVRTNLSKGLGFSREDRDLNIRRIGFVCHLLTRHGVLAIASAVSPFREARDANRRLIGQFVEIYVKASPEACEKRDVKGLYRKARDGEIRGFTGVDDPYEEPVQPDVVCETESESEEASLKKIIQKLEQLGYLEAASAKGEHVGS